MNENYFFESDSDKGYIESVGSNYLIIVDLTTKDKIKIEIDTDIVEHFKSECSDGELVYICYDKKTKRLI